MERLSLLLLSLCLLPVSLLVILYCRSSVNCLYTHLFLHGHVYYLKTKSRNFVHENSLSNQERPIKVNKDLFFFLFFETKVSLS